MSDVLITPASSKIEFKDASNNIDGIIQLDASGNLEIKAPNGDIALGDTSADVYIGDGVSNVDIVFEQDGEIRGLTGVTLTLGQSDSYISFAAPISSSITVSGTVSATRVDTPWARKTSNYTAVSGDKLIADTSGGAFTITLPASPSTGDNVTIADGADWSSTNLTVARNGSTIEGSASNLTVDIGTIEIKLIYDGSTWEVFSTITSGGGGGGFSAINYILS